MHWATIARKATDRSLRLANSNLYGTGKQALVLTQSIKLELRNGATPKLVPKYLGPSTVAERVGPVVYRSNLEGTVLSACHNTFHVVGLHPLWSGGSMQPPITQLALSLESHRIEKLTRY